MSEPNWREFARLRASYRLAHERGELTDEELDEAEADIEWEIGEIIAQPAE